GHLALTARFGLQASHLALGLVLGAMLGTLIWRRVWAAARTDPDAATPAEALGRHYGSVTLRLAVIAVAVLQGWPLAAHLLSQLGVILAAASYGAIGRVSAVWLLAAALMLPAVIGGWRAAVLIAAVETLILAIAAPLA